MELYTKIFFVTLASLLPMAFNRTLRLFVVSKTQSTVSRKPEFSETVVRSLTTDSEHGTFRRSIFADPGPVTLGDWFLEAVKASHKLILVRNLQPSADPHLHPELPGIITQLFDESWALRQ